jgi:hypothetical protein
MAVVAGLGDGATAAAHVALAIVVGGLVLGRAHPATIDVEATEAPAARVTDPGGVVHGLKFA